MGADRIWLIVICCGKLEIGEPVRCCGWDVLSKLAAIRSRIPAGWGAEAYPEF